MFFPYDIFRPPSLICFEFFPFLKYMAMAPSSRAFMSPYYCELCDRTLVPSANFEEHRVGAIHWGLLEALMKMMGCQLQAFWKDLKVGCRRQKLLAKRAIFEALQKLVEPKNWCVPFFLNLVFFSSLLLFLSFKMIQLVIKITLTHFFPSCVRMLAWNRPYIGGL